MLTHLRRAVAVSAIFFVLLGLAYPTVEWGIGQVFFRHQADGSLSADGSSLLGQQWTGPKWFQGRADSDNAMSSAGNCQTPGFRPTAACPDPGIANQYGPTSAALVAAVHHYVEVLRSEGVSPTNDLVTPSGSSLDPDIAPADAYAEAPAVARANGLSVRQVDALIAAHVQGRQLGFLGEPVVDVLQLNEALAALVGQRSR